MNKFHSVFVGQDGRVWSCGHGEGGRLGRPDEKTALGPKPVNLAINSLDRCVLASLGADHTVLLTEGGLVLTCGLNTHHQLGHTPPPAKVLAPRVVAPRWKCAAAGVCASDFHTVIWTETQLYTCGLHGGQLGHPKVGDSTCPAPKPVSAIRLNEAKIQDVAVSDAATAVLTSRGEVYLLYDYQCKKIPTKNRHFDIVKLCVVGGHLDHAGTASSLQERGSDQLLVMLLSKAGSLFLWQESSARMAKCSFSIRRDLDVVDIALHRAGLIFATADGEAFHGEFRNKKKSKSPGDGPNSSAKTATCDVTDDVEHVTITRIPHVHRAVRVTCEPKATNFAVLQAHPKTSLVTVPFCDTSEMGNHFKRLLDDVSEDDHVHDVVFDVEGVKFPAHRYLVAHASTVLEEVMSKQGDVVKLPSILPQVFLRVLHYIYTGDCDLLHPGVSPLRFPMTEQDKHGEKNESQLLTSVNEDSISAFEFNNRKKSQRKKTKGVVRGKPDEAKAVEKDPLRLLGEAAKKFGLSGLLRRIQVLRFEGGHISSTKGTLPKPELLKLDRKRLQHLWDMTLRADDGMEMRVHKCVLVARLEYFNSMLNHDWLESSRTSVSIPVPGNVLEVLVRFLYTDEAEELSCTKDADLASHTLVVADRYFCSGLKSFAETSLANLLNLRNAAEILQLAVTYNAEQLKACVMEFVCLNLSAVLEFRCLEILPDGILCELRNFYRSWLPCMSRRHITTISYAPTDELIQAVHLAHPVPLDTADYDTLKLCARTPKKKTTPVTKERKTSESAANRRSRNVSITSEDEVAEDAPNKGRKKDEESETWIKIEANKEQKIVRSRLRVIAFAEKEEARSAEFVKLGDKEGGQLKTNVLGDFPSLSDNQGPARCSPRSRNVEGNKKFTKISQKQRRILANSMSEDEDGTLKPETPPPKVAWGGSTSSLFPKSDISPISDVMSQEKRQRSSVSSPSSPSTNSLSEIMAAERHSREAWFRLKSKPLEYTQIEDQAIEDLLVLYKAHSVTDERITVRRLDIPSLSLPPPTWVSGHK